MKVKNCCERMAEEQKEMEPFRIWENTIELTYDYGHGGLFHDVLFCPFCGKKLEIVVHE